MIEEILMSVKIDKNEDGMWTTQFRVHSEGGTINEFTFGKDEEEAKVKTNHLVQNILLGLEYVQGQVQEAYAEQTKPEHETR